MGIDQAIIETLIRRVLDVTVPDRIILFGSAAGDSMTPDSDIDLLVLLKEVSRDRSEWLRITRALRDLPWPSDVVLMTAKRFDESKHVVGGIAYPANKYGRVLYEAA